MRRKQLSKGTWQKEEKNQKRKKQCAERHRERERERDCKDKKKHNELFIMNEPNYRQWKSAFMTSFC